MEYPKIKHLIIATLSMIMLPAFLFAAVIESQQSGQWHETSTWAGGSIPSFDDHVVIRGDHKIEIPNSSSNVVIDALTIDRNDVGDSTTLKIDANRRLTVVNDVYLNDNGSGVGIVVVVGTLEVNGDIHFLGSSSDAAQIQMTSWSSELNLKGDLKFTNEGRIFTNTSVYGTIRLTGNSVQNFELASGSSIPNLEIENSAGVNLMSPIDGFSFIGDLTIRISAVFNVFESLSNPFNSLNMEPLSVLNVVSPQSMPEFNFYNMSSSSNVNFVGIEAVVVEGLRFGAAYPNLTFNTSGGVTLGGNIMVAGNLTIEDYSFNPSVFGITLNGSGSQTINVKGTSNKLYNLIINKSSQHVELANDLVIQNNLTLTSGVISTGLDHTLIMESTSSGAIVSYGSGSFVNGNLRRHIANNTDTYPFPVGNGTSATSYFLADLVNQNLSGVNYLDVHIKGLTNHNEAAFETMELNDDSIAYTSVSDEAVWSVIPDNQPTGGSYGLRLHIENFSGLLDNRFALLKRIDGGSEQDWTAEGTISGVNGNGRLLSHGYAYRFNYTSFSEFAMGSGESEVELLPITLLSFDAFMINNQKVGLDWITETEIDNDYFTIEKSEDGMNFHTLKTVQGAGNSVMRQAYKAYDYSPYAGITYYRLLQTDFDGTMDTFHIVSVEASKKLNTLNAVYPNPAIAGSMVIIDMEFTGLEHEIKIYNLASGQVVHRERMDYNSETRTFRLPEHLAKGIYVVKVTNGYMENNSIPLIVQ